MIPIETGIESTGHLNGKSKLKNEFEMTYLRNSRQNQRYTPPKFNISPLKNDGIQTTFLLGPGKVLYVKLPGTKGLELRLAKTGPTYCFLEVPRGRFPKNSLSNVQNPHDIGSPVGS